MNATINVSGAQLIAVVNTAFVIGMVVYIVGALCSLGARPRSESVSLV